MRAFEYLELGADLRTPITMKVTEEEILHDYFPYWLEYCRTRNKFLGTITHAVLEACIEDFCVSHWATEVKNETKISQE